MTPFLRAIMKRGGEPRKPQVAEPVSKTDTELIAYIKEATKHLGSWGEYDERDFTEVLRIAIILTREHDELLERGRLE